MMKKKSFLLLCSMPDSLDGFIMNFANTKDLTMESIISMLLFEENHRKSCMGSLANVIMVRRRFMERITNLKNNSRTKLKGH